ncbi:carboxypeptidase regulatory-like domain-containing protein [Psychroserpens damuponensis]|uniref:carboxypeptidase regulatory-like domain-containing protein n=1 Tax=Psychroserpens damuponensis TaxID=943936 RepID=UPI00058E7D88|nr:carboxypeptidase regulatory-like domain-containing protein [Psychroserpens damuponensis]
MKNSNIEKFKYVVLAFFSLCFLFGNSQSSPEDILFEAYKNYTKLPRETAYGHLNKSTLIKGETLGFSIYLFDKNTKKSSIQTKNVYCTIQNRSGKILKKKMLLAKNGVASGVFEIDSLFTSGNYVFKAYTNWMRNFEEQNFYVQHLKVINPDEDPFIEADDDELYDLDAQFLPEGGHLLLDTKNTVGVVIKDDYGFGVPNLKGKLLNSNGEEVTHFETNSHGISKFEFTPVIRTVYTVKLSDIEQTEITLDIGDSKGVNMTLQDLNDKVALVIRTNASTLPDIANKTFKLAVGNGSQLNISDIIFKDNTEIKAYVSHQDFTTGINIITLFDENNKPLLERLYFKHDGIKAAITGVPSVKKLNDSLMISIPSASINSKQFNNVSVSVLPSKTKSYNHHHNIISYTFLQPYIKGRIENARYYFTNVDRQKRAELDNLLMTQGWSSYDWTNVFKNVPSHQYDFEDGISIHANVNNTKGDKFLIYPLQHSPTVTATVKDGESNFSARGFLPLEKETLKIGLINKQDKVLRPNLYVQFSPSEIPKFDQKYASLKYKNNVAFRYDGSLPILDESWNKIEALDTVLLSVIKEKERIEKIKRFNYGRVDVFTNEQRMNITDFSAYINTKGYLSRIVYPPGEHPNLKIETLRTNTINSSTAPLIYIDNIPVSDFNLLLSFDMSTVDYIIINKQGLDEGNRGGNGVIKIVTNPLLKTAQYSNDREPGQTIKFPLSFATSKTFYTPTYSTYLNDFYQKYGVIDWFPKCKSSDNGTFTLKILDTKNEEIKLFIEGVANDGAYISEEKIVTIN